LDLRRQLTPYTDQRDVNDLLAVISDSEGREADMMRRLLSQNLHRGERLPFAS
jgi:hypothetical protein